MVDAIPLIEPHYLPSVSYMQQLYNAPSYCFEVWSKYVPQRYTNRCYLLASQGIQKLVVPIEHDAPRKALCETKIAKNNWARQHWQALTSAYGKAPYWDFLEDLLAPIFKNPPTLLVELNRTLIKALFAFLQHPNKSTTTKFYTIKAKPGFNDLRNTFYPSRRKGKHEFKELPPYPQRFGNYFSPDLTILDLLFNQGPKARQWLTYQKGSSRKVN